MQTNHKLNHLLFIFGLTLALTILFGTVAARAQATSVFTTGLNNPAKIITAGQASLMVAEAGTTASNSGRVSLVNRATGGRQTLIDNLPSAVNNLGGAPAASGPSGLKLLDRTLYLSVGVGNAVMNAGGPGLELPNPNSSSQLFDSVLQLSLPADYETLASGFTLSAANQTTLAAGSQVILTNAEGKQLTVRMVINLPDFRAEPRPDAPNNVRASNLYGIEAAGDSLYVVDASFNLVHLVNIAGGTQTTFVTFAPKPNPTMTGPPMVDAVPDNIRLVGNQFLVPYLTGFPFVQGLAEIRSVNLQSGAQSTFIPNLTTAIDVLPFNGTGDNDSYLVLEFSANYLAQAPGRLKLFTSRSESPRILASNLITPTSFARDSSTGSIFVTENTPGRITRVSAPKVTLLDYFATGKSDYVLFSFSENPSFIRWNLLRNPVTQPAQIRQTFWGLVDDVPVFGDYDGDLKMDVGVWRPGTAANPQSYFYIQRSSNPNPNAIYGQPWGLPTDNPTDGDFDGDGKDDFTVARIEGANLSWYMLPSGGGSVRRTVFGAATDFAYYQGEDFNNDGREDLIVIRGDPATGNITTYAGDALTGSLLLAQQWGNENAAQGGAVILFYGNYIGDSRADIVAYYGACPSNPTCELAGTFWIKETGSSNFTVTKFGVPFNGQTGAGDLPTEGDFDGDGRLDITVFRPGNATFYSLLSSNGQIKAQFFNGNSATPPANRNMLENPFEPGGKSIPASALKALLISKQPDGAFKMERASDLYFKR